MKKKKLEKSKNNKKRWFTVYRSIGGIASVSIPAKDEKEALELARSPKYAKSGSLETYDFTNVFVKVEDTGIVF